jgi:hypothetical protein
METSFVDTLSRVCAVFKMHHIGTKTDFFAIGYNGEMYLQCERYYPPQPSGPDQIDGIYKLKGVRYFQDMDITFKVLYEMLRSPDKNIVGTTDDVIGEMLETYDIPWVNLETMKYYYNREEFSVKESALHQFNWIKDVIQMFQ